jgi:hypothetical protein
MSTETSLDREMAEIVAAYGDILNTDGPESPRELAYLKKYADNPEVFKLLRCARAVKALFDCFGDMPDLSSVPDREQKPEPKSL